MIMDTQILLIVQFNDALTLYLIELNGINWARFFHHN